MGAYTARADTPTARVSKVRVHVEWLSVFASSSLAAVASFSLTCPAPQSRTSFPQDATALSGQIATPVAATTPGRYGGGFIEMLMTGGQSEPSADYAPQPRARQIVSTQPGQSLDVQRQIDPMYQRTEIDYQGGERSGSIVVDTTNKFLYYVKSDGRAIRYGIGVGRPGFVWSGVKTISRKAEWPDWTPPREMLARRPDLPRTWTADRPIRSALARFTLDRRSTGSTERTSPTPSARTSPRAASA